MNRCIVTLVIFGVGILGLGFYQGWFRLESDQAEGKRPNVTLSMDKDKFQEDRTKAEEKVQAVEKKIKDKVAGPSEKSKDGTHAAVASNSHDGQVVSITSDELVMTNSEGKEKHTHALTTGIKVTCDGKVCKVLDLKAGMRIRVTTENAEPHGATRIEALDSNRDFEKGA
jgi:hypothetical protein